MHEGNNKQILLQLPAKPRIWQLKFWKKRKGDLVTEQLLGGGSVEYEIAAKNPASGQ